MEETQGNLHPEIDVINLPRWDRYYLKTCDMIASQSACMSRHIGAILVKDKSIISTGYCGPPREIPHCDRRHYYDERFFQEMKKKVPDYAKFISKRGCLTACPRRILGYSSGEGVEWCPSAHAERNAIDNAARHGICVNNSIMYMNCGIPCHECLKSIINAGIHVLVVTRKSFYDEMSKYFVRHASIFVREYGEADFMTWNTKLSYENLRQYIT